MNRSILDHLENSFLRKNRTAFSLFKSEAVRSYAKFIDLTDWFCKPDLCDVDTVPVHCSSMEVT